MITKANLLLVYEAMPVAAHLQHQAYFKTPFPILPIAFVKKFSRAMPVQAASSSVPRHLLPFKTLTSLGDEYYGVFGMGIRPFWLVSTRTSNVRLHSSGHNVVFSITPTSAFGSRNDFLVQTDEVGFLLYLILYRSHFRSHLSP